MYIDPFRNGVKVRKGGGRFILCCLRVFRVVVRVFSPTCRVQSCTHLWCVCVGRLSCWGGRSPRRAGGRRGGGILSLHFLAFFPDPTPPLTPLVRAPLLRVTDALRPVCFSRPRPLRCVCCPARMWCLRRRVYLILVCVCVCVGGLCR